MPLKYLNDEDENNKVSRFNGQNTNCTKDKMKDEHNMISG